MISCTCCRAEVTSPQDHGALCAACLLRLGLELEAEDVDLVIGDEAHRVLGPIGRGPNGTAYLGSRIRHPPRFVTVKVIEQPVDVEAFVALMHAVIGRLHGVRGTGDWRPRHVGVMDDGRAYVCSEYAPGRSIDQHFAAHGTPRQRVELLATICRGLADLHGCGVAHGSIKPQNVIAVAAPAGVTPALLDAGIRPVIEASWVSRRVVGGRNRPEEELDAHPRLSADVKALHRLVCELLDTRTDLAVVCRRIRGYTAEAVLTSAADLENELTSALEDT